MDYKNINKNLNKLNDLSVIIDYSNHSLPTEKHGKGEKVTFLKRIYCMFKTGAWSRESALQKTHDILLSFQQQKDLNPLEEQQIQKFDSIIERVQSAVSQSEKRTAEKTVKLSRNILSYQEKVQKDLNTLYKDLHPDHASPAPRPEYTQLEKTPPSSLDSKMATPKNAAKDQAHITDMLKHTGREAAHRQMIDTVTETEKNQQSLMPQLQQAGFWTDSLAAHIIAPRDLKGTGLEGNIQENTIGAMANVFDRVVQGQGLLVQRKEVAEHAIALKKQQHGLQRMAELTQVLTEPAFSVTNLIQKQEPKFLEDLEKYGETWIPGGYEGETGGHATVFRLFKDTDENYGFSIYNSGDGIQFHSQKQIDDKTKYDLVYTYRKIPSKSIFKEKKHLSAPCKGLIAEIIKIHTARSKAGAKLTNLTADDLYLLLNFHVKTMGGIKAKDREGKHHYKLGQIAGTCTWHSLMAMTREHLPRKLHHRMKLETQISCLSSLMQLQRSSRQLFSQERELILQEGLKNIAKTAHSNYEKGRITEDESHQIAELLQTYEKELVFWIQQREKKEADPVSVLENFKKTHRKDIQAIYAFTPNQSRIYNQAKSSQIPSSAPSVTPTFSGESISDVIPFLNNLLIKINNEPSWKNTDFYQVLRSIPLPNIDGEEGIWNQEITPDQAKELIHLVSSIAKKITFDCESQSLENKEALIHYTSLYLTAIHIVEKTYPKAASIQWDVKPLFDPMQLLCLSTGDHFLDKRWMQAKEYAEHLNTGSVSTLSAFGDATLEEKREQQQKQGALKRIPKSSPLCYSALQRKTIIGENTLNTLSEVALLDALPSKQEGVSQYKLIEASILTKYQSLEEKHKKELDKWEQKKSELVKKKSEMWTLLEESQRKHSKEITIKKALTIYREYDSSLYSTYWNKKSTYNENYKVEHPALSVAQKSYSTAEQELDQHVANKPEKDPYIKVPKKVRIATEILQERTPESTPLPALFTQLTAMTKAISSNWKRIPKPLSAEETIEGHTVHLNQEVKRLPVLKPTWEEQRETLALCVTNKGKIVRDEQAKIAISKSIYATERLTFDLETEQSLRALRADKGSQVQSVLEYIQLHPEKIATPSIQEYLLFLLREPGLLQERILAQPDFLQQISNLCTQNLSQQFTSPSNIENKANTIYFLLEVWGTTLAMAEQMSQDPEIAGRLMPLEDVIDTQWYQWCVNLQQGIEVAKKSNTEKALLYTQAILWAHSLPTPGIDQQLSMATTERIALFLEAKKFTENTEGIKLKRKINKDRQTRSSYQVGKILQGRKKEEIVGIASLVYGEGWTQTGNLILEKNQENGQTIHIDLLSGSEYIDGKKTQPAPLSVLQQEEYQLLFGNTPLESGIIITETIPGKYYKKTRSFYKGSYEGIQYQVEYNPADGKIIDILRKDSNGKTEKLQTIPPDKALYEWDKKEHYFWVGKKDVTVVKKKDHTVAAKIDPTGITRTAEDGHSQMLFTAPQDQIISGKKQVRLWKSTSSPDQDSFPEQLEYTNFDLSFSKTTGNPPRLQWDQNPSYHLVDEHHYNFLQGFTHYHVVASGSVEKAIFPKAYYEERKPIKNETLRNVEFTDTEPSSTIVVDIIDGKLCPTDRESALYLTYLAMGRRDYKAANHFLSYVNTDSCFSTEEHDLVEKILHDIPIISGAKHPSLFQLQIKVASLEIQAARRISSTNHTTKNQPLKNRLHQVYENFISYEKYSSKEFAISPEEELDLIQYLFWDKDLQGYEPIDSFLIAKRMNKIQNQVFALQVKRQEQIRWKTGSPVKSREKPKELQAQPRLHNIYFSIDPFTEMDVIYIKTPKIHRPDCTQNKKADLKDQRLQIKRIFTEVFSSLNKKKQKASLPFELSPFTTSSDFTSRISNLYQIARSGSKKEKVALQNLIQTFQQQEKDTDQKYIDFLLITMAMGKRAPSIKSKNFDRKWSSAATKSYKRWEYGIYFTVKKQKKSSTTPLQRAAPVTTPQDHLLSPIEQKQSDQPEKVLSVHSDLLLKGQSKGERPLRNVWHLPTSTAPSANQADDPLNFVKTAAALLSETEKQQFGAYVERRCKEIQEDVAKGAEQNREKRELYQTDAKTLIESQQVMSLYAAIDAHLKDATTVRDSLEKNVLALANRLEKKTSHSVLTMLSRSRKKSRQLQMEDLIKMYIQKDLVSFRENTTLDDEEIQNLYNLLTQYFQISSRCQQLQRALSSSEEIITDDLSEKNIEKARETLEILYTERHFTIKEHPELLVFEHLSGFSLRKNQVAIILDMIEGKEGVDSAGFQEVVHQMIMGGGKSKVLLPLLALMRARGDNLSVLMVPKALYETNVTDLRKENRRFGQELRTLEFSRTSDTSADTLKTLYEDLQRWKENREFIVITDETSHCLDLKYIELHDQLLKDPYNRDLFNSISYLALIREMRSKEWDVLIDEVHLVASPTKETNYTIGEPVKAKKTDYMAISQLYRILDTMTIGVGNREVSVKTLLADGSMSKALAVPGTATIIRDKIIKEILKQEITIYNDDGTTLSKKITGLVEGVTAKDVEKYLTGEKSLDAFDKLYGQGGNSQKFANLCGLFRMEISSLLGSTLKRTPEENFALSKKQRDYLIPLPCSAAAKVIEGAEFSSHFETINYIHQYYKKVDIPEKDAKKLLEQLKEKTISEWSGLGGSIHPDQTHNAQIFMHAFGREISSFDPTIADDVVKFTALLNKKKNEHSHTLELFLTEMVFPQIEVFTKQLRGTSRNLLSPFRSTQAFTGTPFNWRTYHDRLTTKLNEGTDGETIDHLRRKKTPVHCLEGKSPEEVLTQVFSKHSEKSKAEFSAFIDVGASFANQGLKNYDVIREIRDYYRDEAIDKQYFLYFDDQKNQLCYITKESDEPQFDIENLPKDRSCVFTYYDQQHCTGTDIPQPPTGRAITSVSEKTVQSDLLQGVMRMRGLAKEQEIEIIIPKELAESLLQKKAAEIAIDDILALAFVQQIKTEATQTANSAVTGIQDVARQWALSVLTEAAKWGSFQLPSFYKHLAPLLVDTLSEELYLQNAGENVLLTRNEFLEKQRSLIENQITNICEKLGIDQERSYKQEFSKKMDAVVEKAYENLPEKIPGKSSGSGGVAFVEKHVAKHTKKHVEQHKQLETMRQNFAANLESEKEMNWISGRSIGQTYQIHSTPIHQIPVMKDLPFVQDFSNVRISQNFLQAHKNENVCLGTKFQKDCYQYIIVEQEGGALELLIVTHKEAALMTEKLKKQDSEQKPCFYVFSVTGRPLQAGKNGFDPLEGREDELLDFCQKALLLTGRYRKLIANSTEKEESWIRRQKQEDLFTFTKALEKGSFISERMIREFFCTRVGIAA